MGYTAGSFTAGEQPTTSKWNLLWSNDASFADGTGFTDGTHLPKHLVTGTGSSWVWQSWTPTWVNLTIGNATVDAKYIQTGKTVLYRVVVQFGSTTSVGTSPTFTLPITSITVPNVNLPIGWGQYNTGSGAYNAFIKWATTTTGKMMYWDTNNNEASITATAPGTWSSAWFIFLQGQYEAA